MHHYLGCGLDNIHLRNGYDLRRTKSGTEVVWIDDVVGLHRTIAKCICDLTCPLAPREFKFLRKELDLSQRQVADRLEVDEKTVYLWERGELPIISAADVLLRELTRAAPSEDQASSWCTLVSFECDEPSNVMISAIKRVHPSRAPMRSDV